MELFSLLAKLTLDSKEYEKGLQQAKSDAEDLDVVEPQLGLDSQEFNDNLDAAEEHGQGFEGSMTSVFGGIKNALVTTGIVAAVAGIVNSIKEAVNLTAETADQIDKGSRRLGISAKSYQEWDHALRQSGASINDLQKGILQFNKYIAGDKTDEMSEAFEKLGIDADKAGMSTEQLMHDTLTALADFKGTSEERGVLVTALFGRGGTNLNALLDSGKKGVEDLLNEAEDLGLVMSDDEITNAVAYGDAVANLNAELAAIKTAFVQDIIPVLTSAVSWLTDFLAKLNPRLRTSTIFDTINDINKKTLEASRNVDAAQTEANSLIEKLMDMGDYWTLDAEGKMTWDALAARALELFPQLTEFIDRDAHKIKGNTKDIEANIDAWARLEKQRLLASALDEKSKAIAEQLVKAYDKGAQAELKEAEAEGKRVIAIGKLNDMLKENGRQTIDATASEEEMSKALTDFIESLPEDDPLQVQAGLIFKDWGEAKTEAAKLRGEADKMIEDAEKAQSELDAYQVKLAEQMGLTADDVLKVKSSVEDLDKSLRRLPKGARIEVQYEEHENAFRHAIGSAYVPYDDYPALLHRGERVLTATEARQERSESIDLNALEERLVAAIRNGMENATVRSYIGEREVTDIVSQQLANELNNRR